MAHSAKKRREMTREESDAYVDMSPKKREAFDIERSRVYMTKDQETLFKAELANAKAWEKEKAAAAVQADIAARINDLVVQHLLALRDSDRGEEPGTAEAGLQEQLGLVLTPKTGILSSIVNGVKSVFGG